MIMDKTFRVNADAIVGEVKAPTLTSVEILPENLTTLKGQIYPLRAVGYD